MYKYRVYLEKQIGYELEEFLQDEEELYQMLDYYILDIEYQKKILVIEYNRELNQDSVFYLYTGNFIPVKNEYMQMRLKYDKEQQRIKQKTR